MLSRNMGRKKNARRKLPNASLNKKRFKGPAFPFGDNTHDDAIRTIILDCSQNKCVPSPRRKNKEQECDMLQF